MTLDPTTIGGSPMRELHELNIIIKAVINKWKLEKHPT